MKAHAGNILRNSMAAAGKRNSGDQSSSSLRIVLPAMLRTSLLYQNFSIHRDAVCPVHRSFWRSTKLLRLYPHISELAKIMIEAGDGQIFRHGGGGDQAVHKMNLSSSEAIESV